MDWNSLSLSNLWATFLTNIKGIQSDQAKMFVESGSYSNIPDGTIRLNQTTKRFEKYTLATATWSPVLTFYDILVSSLYGLTASIEELNTVADGDTAKNNHKHGIQGCLLYKTSNQEIAMATASLVIFGGEKYDTNGMHTNSEFLASRITIPAGATLARFGGLLIPSHPCVMYLKKNGANYMHLNDPTADDTVQRSYSFCTPFLMVEPDDYFEISVYRESSSFDVYGSTEEGNILLQSSFSAEIL